MPEYQSFNSRQAGKARSGWQNPNHPARNANAGQSERPIRPNSAKRKPQSRINQNKTSRSNLSSVKPRKVRRGNPVLYFLMFGILAAIILPALSVTVLFNVSEVHIDGESTYSNEEIMAAGNIELGTNLWRFKSEPAEKDIMESLVRLDGVSVKRVFGFPSSITITVQSADRMFSIYDDDSGLYLEVSSKGRIINSRAKPPKGLVITGFEPESTQVGDYLDCGTEENTALTFQFSELIQQYALSQVSRVDIADRFDIRMFYDDERIEVLLGAPSQLDEKLAVTAKIISEEIDDNEKGQLRISNPRKASFKPYI